MEKLLTTVKVTILLAASLYCAGCLSVWSHQASLDEIRRQRIADAGDEKAIKELSIGVSPAVAIKAVSVGDGAGIGIDVTQWEALKNHPIRQTLAAIGDAALLYATKELVDELDKDSSSRSGSRNVSVNVNGSDDTVVTVNNNDTETTTTTTSTDNSDNSDRSDNSATE